jgi:hypothetical protein
MKGAVPAIPIARIALAESNEVIKAALENAFSLYRVDV